MPRIPLWIGAVLMPGAIVAGCSGPPPEIPSPPFDEIFDLVEVVTLEEAPGDSVAEVGTFAERMGEGFIVADRLLPRIRSYAEDGSLLAAFGRFGRGPWEFAGRVGGVAELPSGKIAIADATNILRITFLTHDLSPDTIMSFQYLVLDVHALGEDIVFFGYGPVLGERVSILDAMTDPRIHMFRDDSVAWSRFSREIYSKPYVFGLSGLAWTVAGDSVFGMASLEYPAAIFNSAGDSAGTIGTPSPRFRPIPDIPEGYFATQQSGTRVADLLRSFDTVDRLDVIHSDHLVFTIGRLDHLRPYPPFKMLHTRVEIYNRHTGEKLYEDVPLPAGAKVLGGGRHLYLLLNPDIPPWRIAKYRLAEARGQGRS